jgi:hypothetical protein
MQTIWQLAKALQLKGLVWFIKSQLIDFMVRSPYSFYERPETAIARWSQIETRMNLMEVGDDDDD